MYMCNCMCTEKFLFCIVKNWKDIQRVLLRKKSAEKKPKSKLDPEPFGFFQMKILKFFSSVEFDIKNLENHIFQKIVLKSCTQNPPSDGVRFQPRISTFWSILGALDFYKKQTSASQPKLKPSLSILFIIKNH